MKAEELQKAACFRILHWIQTEEQKMGQAASQNRCPNEKKLIADYTLSLFKFNWTQMWKFLMSREVNYYKSFYLKIQASEKALQSLKKKDWRSFHVLNLYLCKCLCSTQDLLLRSVYCCLLCVPSLAFLIKLIAMERSWYWYSGKFSLVQIFV